MDESRQMGDGPAVQRSPDLRRQNPAQQQGETPSPKKRWQDVEDDSLAQETRITDWAAF